MPGTYKRGSTSRLGKITGADGEPSLPVVRSVAEHPSALDQRPDRRVVGDVDRLARISYAYDLDQAKTACAPSDVEEEAERVMRNDHAFDDATNRSLPDELVPFLLGRLGPVSVRRPLIRFRRHSNSVGTNNHARGSWPRLISL